MQTFKTKDVLKFTGLTRSSFDRWIWVGVIAKQTKGSGYPTEYTEIDMVRLVVLRKLQECGFRIKEASKLTQQIRHPGADSLEVTLYVGFAKLSIDLRPIWKHLNRFIKEKNHE